MFAAFRPKAQITNGQVVILDKAYSLSEIVSAEVAEKPFKLTVPLAVFLWLVPIGSILGLIIRTTSSQSDIGFLHNVPYLLVILGCMGVAFIVTKGRYIVRLKTKSGLVDAYSSDNKKQIKRMVDAINAAIAEARMTPELIG